LLAEYVARCKTIKLFDVRVLSRELAKDTAVWLKAFRRFCFDFVAVACNTIARCIVLTEIVIWGKSFKGLPQFLQPLKRLVSLRRAV